VLDLSHLEPARLNRLVITLPDREVIEGASDDGLVAPITMIVGEVQRVLEIDHLAIDTNLLDCFADRSLTPTLM